MVLKRQDLRNQLQRGEIAPVYTLFGPETQLRDAAAKYIANLSFDSKDFRDFNDTTFSLSNPGSLEQALAAAQQMPMMAKRRVITMRELRVSSTGHRDTVKEDDEPLISSYLDNPSPHAVVIFIADELNGVRKMGKYFRERTTSVEFTKLNDVELAEIARKEVEKAGVSIDEHALRYLLSQLDADVHRLTNEINKLAAAAMPNGAITIELIDSLVANSRELTNFELTDRLVAGEGARALSALRKVLDDGAEPVMLLGLIASNYRRLLMIKELMERGAERGEIERTLNMRYSNQAQYMAAARRSDIRSLKRAIARLAKTDLAIKTSSGGSGPAGARLQIEMLVCELALL